MCGIAGFLGPVDETGEADLERMGAALAHRGPDSSGTWIDRDAGVGLAHRRLAVVGLGQGGHQPMVSPSGRYVVSFNGEIYNHETLRRELERAGEPIAWRGSSDTETLLATIERHGLRTALDSWVGMFAFALWDRRERRLTLGRDRFGEKPLSYGRHRDRFLFASELGAIRAVDGFDAGVDRGALAAYFRHHYVPAPLSILDGFVKLEPGCLAIVDAARAEPRVERYWSAVAIATARAQRPFTGDLAEATDEVEARLTSAIAAQAVADVPVGAFLSGGIDSSTVVALMQRTLSRPVRTFSIGFDDAAFDESPRARAVAEHLRTEHTELILSGSDARDFVPVLPGLHDEPFADPSELPTALVSRLAREQVTVSLSGDGGDELFGGYTRYAQAARMIAARRRWGGIGRRIGRTLIGSGACRVGLAGHVRLAVGAERVARPAGRALQLLAARSDGAAYRDMLSFWRAPRSPVPGSVEPAPSGFLVPEVWGGGRTPQAAVQLLDVLNYLPDDILVKVDRAAMHVSLETRVPLLDHRLAEFVWSLPADYRASAARPKRILFDIACRHLPRALIERPKMGFGIPLASWLRGDLRDWAEALLEERSMREAGYLDAATVARVWRAFLAGDDAFAAHVWGVLAFQAWLAGASGR